MTAIRTEGPTPGGGDYTIAVFVKLDGLVEVDRADADGLIITEYTSDGAVVHETVGEIPEGSALDAVAPASA